MLGIVIDGMTRGAESFNPAIYHRFGDRTVLERTMDVALMTAQGQKTIVLMPLEQRSNVNGGYTKDPLVDVNRAFNKKAIQWHWYDGDWLDGLYESCIVHNLDCVVRIWAHSPCIRPWLINAAAELHHRTGGHVVVPEGFDLGFNFQVLPFWVIADAFVKQEERDSIILDLHKMHYPISVLRNNAESDNYIPVPKETMLAFTDPENQHETFQNIFDGLDKGYDIAELIEGLNGTNGTAATG